MEPSISGPEISRRAILLGAAALGLPLVAVAAPSDAPDLEAARREGPLVIWHADQESDVVQFLNAFKAKTGIEAVQQHLLPGVALPKLMTQLRAGATEVDVFDASDAGLMEQLRKQGHLLRYESPEIAAYAPQYRSEPTGYWTTYYINIGPIMYDPRYVDDASAPKTWLDLLDPRWKNQLGFQNAAAGGQYAWWYLVKNLVPADYWDRLAVQKPRSYASSTQLADDITSGNLKMGGRVNTVQFVRAQRQKVPMKMVFPPEGTPAFSEVVGIIAPTKRPNAAKAYVDFLLSKEGQESWNTIQGASSARPDAHIPGLPDTSKFKIILPTDMEDYGSPANHAKFVKLWNQITGF
ncbi:ABC transporter substrate-binding protein [Acidisphaera sp. L21]|jgi:iron(III) transport system substrate-binding protein|uniref:ABC transporter substrate-binding protein n=1 Tax=Acidisphaera sp. L21 TaxID=1641851 RepID=UPI00131DBC3C|nr:ABC transporter substrate-binding protein [Acidisphaera sp. L21]